MVAMIAAGTSAHHYIETTDYYLGGREPAGRWIAVASGLPLAIGAVGYGASITLWVLGARDLGAARGQLVFATAPFVGALVAWSVLGDPVRTVEVVALVLAVAGVSRVLGSSHSHEHRHQAVEHEHEHVHDDGHHDHRHGPGVSPAERHTHRHRHEDLLHAHPHVPDLHHRHDHA